MKQAGCITKLWEALLCETAEDMWQAVLPCWYFPASLRRRQTLMLMLKHGVFPLPRKSQEWQESYRGYHGLHPGHPSYSETFLRVNRSPPEGPQPLPRAPFPLRDLPQWSRPCHGICFLFCLVECLVSHLMPIIVSAMNKFSTFHRCSSWGSERRRGLCRVGCNPRPGGLLCPLALIMSWPSGPLTPEAPARQLPRKMTDCFSSNDRWLAEWNLVNRIKCGKIPFSDSDISCSSRLLMGFLTAASNLLKRVIFWSHMIKIPWDPFMLNLI